MEPLVCFKSPQCACYIGSLVEVNLACPSRSLAGLLPAPTFPGTSLDWALSCLSPQKQISTCAHLRPLPWFRDSGQSQPRAPTLPSTLQSGSLWVSCSQGCIWCLPVAQGAGLGLPGGTVPRTAHLTWAIFISKADCGITAGHSPKPT